jgi:hypothetical protein
LGNHDNSRVGSRYGADRIDALNTILLTLPGAGVTYNVIYLVFIQEKRNFHSHCYAYMRDFLDEIDDVWMLLKIITNEIIFLPFMNVLQ